MQKRLEETFAYRGYHGCEGKCRLRVWQEKGKAFVVLFTELEDNPGTSVTNAIEQISWEAFQLLERPEVGLTVIEHYRDRELVGGNAMYKEEFDIVTFTPTGHGFDDPEWRRVSKEEVEKIIGQTLEN